MVCGGEADGDGVMEQGRSFVGAPVHGVDAEACGRDDGFHIFYALHGVVADGHSCVALSLCGFDVAARGSVFWCHFKTHHVGGRQLLVSAVAHVFQQFHHSLPSLTESCDDEWSAGVPLLDEMVESIAYIAHGDARTAVDGVLVQRDPSVDGHVPVELPPH